MKMNNEPSQIAMMAADDILRYISELISPEITVRFYGQVVIPSKYITGHGKVASIIQAAIDKSHRVRDHVEANKTSK